MALEEIYRGHRISYQRGGRVACITRVGSIFALDVFPTATTAEGLRVLKQRAYAAVDAELARRVHP